MCWNNGCAAFSRRGVRFTSASLGSTEPCVHALLTAASQECGRSKNASHYTPPLLQPHEIPTHNSMHRHAHTQPLSVCPSVQLRSNFEPEVLKHQLSINPPQTCTFFVFFFHPWHAGRKTAGLVYTNTCISIT